MVRRMLAAALVVASCGLVTVPRIFASSSHERVEKVNAVGSTRLPTFDMAIAITNFQEQQVGKVLHALYAVQTYADRIRAVRTQKTQQTRSEAAQKRSSSAQGYLPTGKYRSVAECVKSYESGDYREQSHPSSGSGAYQFVPDTWRHYAAAAGHGGYAYAYQAPPAVQDAVFEYALTHGGAHNWDPAYGNDPCTTHLP